MTHLNFTQHVESITKAANRKCHGLVVLKKAGANAATLLSLYRAQIIPTITFAAASWYPFISKHLEQKIEKTQKLALRIIYPNYEHYQDQLQMAQIASLNEALTDICHAYATAVRGNPDHPLAKLVKTRPKGRRFSHRQNNVYREKARTALRERHVLHDSKFF